MEVSVLKISLFRVMHDQRGGQVFTTPISVVNAILYDETAIACTCGKIWRRRDSRWRSGTWYRGIIYDGWSAYRG